MVNLIYVPQAHQVKDEDNSFICKLYVPKGTKLADKEQALESLYQAIFSILNDIDIAEVVLFNLRLLFKEKLQYDDILEQIQHESSKVVSFKDSSLPPDLRMKIHKALNEQVFDCLL